MCQMLELCDVRKECCLYQVRRSPRAELHTTTRHSEWWRLCRRLIQVPSTSVVTVPSWQHTFITHIWPFFMLRTRNFDFLMAEYLHLPCAHSLGLCIRLGPSQNHRSSPHCCWTAGCFWQQGHDECTENMKKKKTWFNQLHIHVHIFWCRQGGTLPCERRETPFLWLPESCKKSGLQAAEGCWIQEENLQKTNSKTLVSL